MIPRVVFSPGPTPDTVYLKSWQARGRRISKPYPLNVDVMTTIAMSIAQLFVKAPSLKHGISLSQLLFVLDDIAPIKTMDICPYISALLYLGDIDYTMTRTGDMALSLMPRCQVDEVNQDTQLETIISDAMATARSL